MSQYTILIRGHLVRPLGNYRKRKGKEGKLIQFHYVVWLRDFVFYSLSPLSIKSPRTCVGLLGQLFFCTSFTCIFAQKENYERNTNEPKIEPASQPPITIFNRVQTSVSMPTANSLTCVSVTNQFVKTAQQEFRLFRALLIQQIPLSAFLL